MNCLYENFLTDILGLLLKHNILQPDALPDTHSHVARLVEHMEENDRVTLNPDTTGPISL